MNYEVYLEQLLNYSRNRYHLSPEVSEAFRLAPRHLFVQEPYSLDEMYADYPLGIYHDENFVSTISQPSFVLLMIDMLDIYPGDKILELGAGSGWNAALMSHVTGPYGLVVSVEIIPKLAEATRKNLKDLGYDNVKIIFGDGALGYAPDAPYDRAIFTAGATDLPLAFHEQVKIGGKLLFVLQSGGADLLILLEKKIDHFESQSYIDCQFVPMKGDKIEAPDYELMEIAFSRPTLKIYPHKRKLPEAHNKKRVIRRDSVFIF